MRIPVRAQLNGYTPALDPFSKDKLIWVKIDIKDGELGIPGKIGIGAMVISGIIGSIWTRSLYGTKSDVNVYRDLGHDKFILLFVIAALVGIFVYFWGLYVYDFKQTKKYPLSKSIELYKNTTLYSKEKQIRKDKQRRMLWKLGIPFFVIFIGLICVGLFVTFKDWSSPGVVLGLTLAGFAYVVYLALYQITVIFSRRYLNRKFNIQFNDKNSVTKSVSK